MKYMLSIRLMAVFALVGLGACGDHQARAESGPDAEVALSAMAAVDVRPDSLAAATEADPQAAPAPASAAPLSRAPDQIRGLYLNAYAAGSRTRLPRIMAIADTTEINTFVIDVKTERGIHYNSEIPLAQELQQDGENTLRNLKTLVDTLHNRGIYAMARIVVFKDPILSKAKPDWSIRTPEGGLWIDRAGNSWVSAWDRNVWDYNLSIAEEAARAGFDEIQFDYVRFPEPYSSLPPQIHPGEDGTRTDAIAAFLVEAQRRLHPLGAIVAADVFGLSPNDPRDVNIGQQWEKLSAVSDHILPMMYPSHYLPTHLPGVRTPDRMPYETLYKSAGMARLRTDRLADAGVKAARVIPWVQGFTATWLSSHLDYGPEELRQQKQGIYDVGFDDWIIWHPGSKYEHLIGGMDREATPQAVSNYTPPEDVLTAVGRFEGQGVAEARAQAAQRTLASD